MVRRLFLSGTLFLAALALTGDGSIQAARCTPLADGRCTVCKNCRYCKHCAKQGGQCTVCKR